METHSWPHIHDLKIKIVLNIIEKCVIKYKFPSITVISYSCDITDLIETYMEWGKLQ